MCPTKSRPAKVLEAQLAQGVLWISDKPLAHHVLLAGETRPVLLLSRAEPDVRKCSKHNRPSKSERLDHNIADFIPLMGVLIGGLFFSERLTPSKIAGVCLGLFGVGILTRAGPVAFDMELLMGALACLLATTCYGFAGFLARRWLDQRGGLDSRLAALGSMLGATLFLLPLFAWSAISHPPASWGGWPVWLSSLGLGLVCTAFAYILYFRLLTSIGPVKSMTVTFMIPPFGVLWGALLLDEPLSMAHLYGGVLIAGALWLVLRPGKLAGKL